MGEKCTDNPRDCPLAPRVKALEEANKQHSATHREIFKRLGGTETNTAVQQKHMENIDKSLSEIKAGQKDILQKVESLEAKPGKRWEGIVDKLIWGVIGVLAGALGSGLIQLLKAVP